MADAANIKISCELSQSKMVDVDSDRAQQVFANLLSNAIKFSQPGSRVDVAGQAKGAIVQVIVTDRGSGIDPGVPAARVRAFSTG